MTVFSERPAVAAPNQDNQLKSEKFGRPVSEFFGELTFGLGDMRAKLPQEAFQNLVLTLEQGKKLSSQTTNAIAEVIKNWAVNMGATHFCHWFQPMTGNTAEKHDAFIAIQYTNHSELKVIEQFTGSQLLQSEPDASSLPSGGMRSTFEARGYTAWDPTSPLFIVEDGKIRTLCIPSVFFGYNGHCLDNKTPLLRSVQSLSLSGNKFLKLLGDVDIKVLRPTLGVEQEYFLIPEDSALKRPDLKLTGRTLIGASSTRGQELEDHYFGSIPSSVQAYMHELELELYRLGVPIKTRHNEVAPSQFEMAPIYEDCIIAADHNALIMDTMRKVANRHGFMCLLHEKPFSGINGSGKHCNWSLTNQKGENLLEPGRTPHQNLRFLALVAVIIKAVKDCAPILNACVSTPSNDLRLGANEAPPSIFSVFLGSALETIFESVAKGGAGHATDSEIINLGVGHISEIARDYSDRNRTSPFAFTGNKFEFRSVGSSANVSFPVAILNSAVSQSFQFAAKRLKELLDSSDSRHMAVVKLIDELYKDGKKVLYSGNNYSEEWRDEAKKRKLSILKSGLDAFKVFSNAKDYQALIDTKVMTREELESRNRVNIERYVKTLFIELNGLMEMVREYVVPAVEKQLKQSKEVADIITSEALRALYRQRTNNFESVLVEVLNRIDTLTKILSDYANADKQAFETLEGLFKKAIPEAEAIRVAADNAEKFVAAEFWKMPKYRDMLYSHRLG